MKIHTYIGDVHKIPYIRISELPEEERQPFTKWLTGQTCPVIPGLVPQDAAFPWDYERWKAGETNAKRDGCDKVNDFEPEGMSGEVEF